MSCYNANVQEPAICMCRVWVINFVTPSTAQVQMSLPLDEYAPEYYLSVRQGMNDKKNAQLRQQGFLVPKYIGAEYLIITLIRLEMAFSCFVAFWVKIYTLTNARCHTPYFSSFVWNQWNGSDFQVDDSRTRIQMHSAQYATSC